MTLSRAETVNFASLEGEHDQSLDPWCLMGRMSRWTGLKSFGAVG